MHNVTLFLLYVKSLDSFASCKEKLWMMTCKKGTNFVSRNKMNIVTSRICNVIQIPVPGLSYGLGRKCVTG